MVKPMIYDDENGEQKVKTRLKIIFTTETEGENITNKTSSTRKFRKISEQKNFYSKTDIYI